MSQGIIQNRGAVLRPAMRRERISRHAEDEIGMQFTLGQKLDHRDGIEETAHVYRDVQARAEESGGCLQDMGFAVAGHRSLRRPSFSKGGKTPEGLFQAAGFQLPLY